MKDLLDISLADYLADELNYRIISRRSDVFTFGQQFPEEWKIPHKSKADWTQMEFKGQFDLGLPFCLAVKYYEKIGTEIPFSCQESIRCVIHVDYFSSQLIVLMFLNSFGDLSMFTFET